MNKLTRWKWLVLSATLFVLPFAAPRQAAGESVSQGSSASMSQAELEQMLAPIALYPDTLLTHILIASTYPLEVVQAQRWLEDNPKLSVDQVMSRTESMDWDPSVKALLAFPTVLQKMNEDLDWTQQLGEAFLANEGQVMDGIQSLRQQADKANSLSNMDNMTVNRTNNQIIIEPARPEVIYVPYYDPRVVYGPWRWGVAYPPVYWDFGGPVGYPYRPGVSIHWSPGINISFNFFFSSFHWHDHRVVVIDHHHSHHYRPLDRYTVSHGAQPWQHRPEHRRGVHYHNPEVKQRYHDDKFRGPQARPNGKDPRFSSQYAKPKVQPQPHPGNKGTEQPRNKGPEKGNQYSRDVKRDMGRDNHGAPNFQNTQAELKERRAAGNQSRVQDRNSDSDRNGNVQTNSNYAQPSQTLPKVSRDQPKQYPQQPAQTRQQPRTLEAKPQVRPQEPRTQEMRVQPQKQVAPRPETRQPQRQEQQRQAAPKPRQEIHAKQSEPRQPQQMARNFTRNPSGNPHIQERSQH